MTHSNDRLDRIETDMDELRKLIGSNARAIQANTESINVLTEAVGRTVRTVEILSQAVEEDRVNFREYRQRNDAQMASLNAAVERLETIVNILVRRDEEP